MVYPEDRLVKEFVGHLNDLERTRKKVESLFQQGSLNKRDIEQVYKGLFLDAISSFEYSVEELFIRILSGRVFNNKKVKIKSLVTARKIIFAGKNYVDWLPYDYTKKRARIFFSSGAPFTNLDRDDEDYLEKMNTIRNAIAHKSVHAKKQFNNKVIESQNLLPSEKTPAGFLRAILSQQPYRITYFETYLSKLTQIYKKFFK